MISCFDLENKDATKYRFAALVEVERTATDPGRFQPVVPRTWRACWLPSAGLRPNMVISLEGQDGLWRVEGVMLLELERGMLHTDWAVGGLARRKRK